MVVFFGSNGEWGVVEWLAGLAVLLGQFLGLLEDVIDASLHVESDLRQVVQFT